MAWERLDIPDADIRIRHGFLAPAAASACQSALTTGVDWRRDSVRVYGRRHPIPRLHQWYGDPGMAYRWSGLTMRATPWTDALAELRDRVGTAIGCRFNSVLVNLYRDGADSVGWHADNEPELGPQPIIASVSLGAERDFAMRYRDRAAGVANRTVALPHGSLLVMAGATQQAWQHSLPRRKRVSEPRINLTFRRIVRS